MCKDELNNESVDFDETIENEDSEMELDECEEKEYYTQEELLDIIDQVIPKVEINTEKLNGLKLDVDSFKKGLKDISFTCGQYAGLMAVGISSQDAFQFVLNESTGVSNEKVTRMQSINQESNQI